MDHNCQVLGFEPLQVEEYREAGSFWSDFNSLRFNLALKICFKYYRKSSSTHLSARFWKLFLYFSRLLQHVRDFYNIRFSTGHQVKCDMIDQWYALLLKVPKIFSQNRNAGPNTNQSLLRSSESTKFVLHSNTVGTDIMRSLIWINVYLLTKEISSWYVEGTFRAHGFSVIFSALFLL